MNDKTIRDNLANELITSLTDNPGDWKWDNQSKEAIITHTSGLGIWVYLGKFELYRPREVKENWTFWQKRRLRRAFEMWQRNVGNAQRSSADRAAMLNAMTMLNAAPLKAVA
jgi:hypothetical protein